MPDWVVAGLQNGWIVTVAVAILLVEVGVLFAMRERLHLDTGPLVCNAISGIALICALGSALREPRDYTLVVLCLSIGFVAHVADIVTRIRKDT